MKVSIVIPNYNGAELLKKNLSSVFVAIEYWKKQSKGNGEIIVVDDGSTDASESIISNIKFQISNFKFIKNEENLGFAATVNRGVKEATGEIVVLLNTDVRPEKEFLIPLLNHFSDPKVFSVGCMDRSIENEKEVLRGRGIGVWRRGFLEHNAGALNKATTLWTSGGSSAFRKSMWDRLGGLNLLYSPFYWEDIDLSYRGWKSGHKVLFEKESVVVHEHEQGSIRSQFTGSVIKKTAYRNQFYFVWLNADDDMLFKHYLWLPFHIITSLLRIDIAFFLGLCDALMHIPQVMQMRRSNKKMFTITDKEVIAEVI